MTKLENNKQNVELAEIKKDIEWLRCEIAVIKDNELVHLKADIKDLSEKMQKKFDTLNIWLVGILASIITLLLNHIFAFWK